MLRKIRLYGELAKFVGHRVLEADVASAAEAVRFLLANWPELEQHMAQEHYRVRTAGHDLGEEDLHFPMGKELRIIPVIVGAGGGVGKIIAGIGLLALAFFAPIIAGALIQSAGLMSFAVAVMPGVQAALVGLGIGAIAGGISQLLAPTPKMNTADEGDPRKSFSFSGIQNTSRAGVPVPVVYGETLVGSVVVSAGIDIVQVTA